MTTPHTPPTQAELDALKLKGFYSTTNREIVHRLITEIERLRAKNTSENLNGNWMDKWGACRICGGEIPHGHTNACDYYRLTKEVEELRKDKERLQGYERRLRAMFPLFTEARDALPAITEVSARLHNIRLDLADRMDEVGNPEKWKAIDSAVQQKGEE